jgi:hypothetical protein
LQTPQLMRTGLLDFALSIIAQTMIDASFTASTLVLELKQYSAIEMDSASIIETFPL